jgi:hypothetical protein
MWNKIAILLILISPPAQASEGKFTFLQQAQCAPFSGTLFDPTATAKLIAQNKFLKEEFDLQLAYQVSVLEAQHALDIEQYKISLDIQERKCNNIISIKDKEIEGLNKIIAKKPGANALMWGIIGGFVAGAAATVGIVYAVNR